jgi:GNAT superfamily N-acetyltransferase
MQRNMIRLVTLTGPAMVERLPDLARLRASVFRDWPYLYDAKPGVEDADMAAIASWDGAALILALKGDVAVGCATVYRLHTETANIQAPFLAAGEDLRRWCYFGESVLEPQYRGQGLGVGFFEAREAHAMSFPEVERATFCSVERPAAHPLRPAGAGDLHAFWNKRGYQPTDLVCTMQWKQIDTEGKVENRLRFWAKTLR